MCVDGFFRWQSELLGLLGGNVCCSTFYVAMSAVGSFNWQYVLRVLVGKVCCWFFAVAS